MVRKIAWTNPAWDEKGATREQAMKAWRKLKSLDVPKNYRSWSHAQSSKAKYGPARRSDQSSAAPMHIAGIEDLLFKANLFTVIEIATWVTWQRRIKLERETL